jgi:hypothetical protein
MTYLAMNLGLRREERSTNCLSYGKVEADPHTYIETNKFAVHDTHNVI